MPCIFGGENEYCQPWFHANSSDVKIVVWVKKEKRPKVNPNEKAMKHEHIPWCTTNRPVQGLLISFFIILLQNGLWWEAANMQKLASKQSCTNTASFMFINFWYTGTRKPKPNRQWCLDILAATDTKDLEVWSIIPEDDSGFFSVL